MLQAAMIIIGALGLALVIVGMFIEHPRKIYIFYILGGIFLAIYSIYVRNVIFIILQLVFTAVAVWKLAKSRKK